jgi:DNA phosphorothioation-dependent restriction protein DptG
VYRTILGPVHNNKKENWRTLTNKEIYASVKKPTITETIRLHILHWFVRIIGGEEWQEKVYNREEWKKLLRLARNRCTLHMPME